MSNATFAKTLSPNDVGSTGSHQAGILVPKSDAELLSFFPHLDATKLNPDAWITCEEGAGREWRLRLIYYNNRLHSPRGTRNEYRLTHLTEFLRINSAQVGDSLVFTATTESHRYRIALEKMMSDGREDGIIRLRGWHRVY
jgi:hypothetical protein